MAVTYNKMIIGVNESINSIGIKPVQNDTLSRYLDVCLYNNGLPIDLTNETVRINFRKEDGTTLFNQGEITNATEGRCQFELTNEILSDAKSVKAQISIWGKEGQILSTQVFTIFVSESIRNDEEVESTNEFGVLVVLFQEIQNALDLMNAMVESFGEAGEMAETYGVSTFWAMLEHLAAGADVKQALKENINSTMDTEEFAPLDRLIAATIEPHGVQEFKASGTFVVPDGVHKILVTACGGGGGGGGPWDDEQAGGGGGGGACIVRKPFAVIPGGDIEITIGTGGNGGSKANNGSKGGSTIIGDLVTLSGGSGGLYKGNGGNGGNGGGGGGAGGYNGSSGTNYARGGCGYMLGQNPVNTEEAGHGGSGICGSGGPGGGDYRESCGGGGGGGSIGAGGKGGYADSSSKTSATSGERGGGGGGGSYDSATYSVNGAKGGSGYALIEW